MTAKVIGTDACIKRRVELSHAQVERILEELPEVGRRGGRPRAFFEVMWETGLRRNTVIALRAPNDWRPGLATLVIRPEADKARYGRTLPISARCQDALARAAGDNPSGLIFPYRDYRHFLRRAAWSAGIEDWEHVSFHDLRHARITYWGENTTSLSGLAYLAGHRHVSTTALYIHESRKAAESVLDALDGEEVELRKKK